MNEQDMQDTQARPMASAAPADPATATPAASMPPDAPERPSTADIARGGATDGADAATRAGDGRAPATPAVTEQRTAAMPGSTGDREPLFPADQAHDLRSRWDSIQVGFVDEPKAAVEQADSLVAEVMQSLAGAFSRERSSLESQWSKGEDVSTEDLRQTLRRYRSFFDRLLSL